jgi:hypothetical protein
MDKSKPNIILDLDQTLIYAEPLGKDIEAKKQKLSEQIKRFAPTGFDIKTLSYDSSVPLKNRNIFIMDNDYIIFLRPGLQDFMDYLFKNFNVCVWTAASKDYALFIIQYILLLMDENETKLDPERHIELIMFYYHCILSKNEVGGTKNLCMLWDKINFDHLTKDNTLILDDNYDVYKTQKDICMQATEFIVSKRKNDLSHEDTFLIEAKADLDKFLEKFNTSLRTDTTPTPVV